MGLFYKIAKKLVNKYERCRADEQKKSLASCGENVKISRDCNLYCSHIHLGNNVSIGEGASFIASVSHIYIGNNVMFGPNVTIRGGDHRTDIIGKPMCEVKERDKLPENDRDVIIEDDVWIACNVTILKGVRIGRGSVIGAGAVVTKSVPPYTIHVGVNSVSEWKRFTDEQIAEHEKEIYKNV